jgi:taurine dioxygenase
VDVKPISPAIGADVGGVDLAVADDATFAELRRLLLVHQVLVLRGQRLDPSGQLQVAAAFGTVEPPHPVVPHLEAFPQVTMLENRDGGGIDFGEWHADTTFRREPALGTVLYARVVPAVGGDTLWANMAAAYDALSPALRCAIDGLTAVHDVLGGGPYTRVPTYRDVLLAGPDGPSRLAAVEADFPPISHPVVRTHPATGRRGLFVNRSFTTTIDGLSRLESAWLLGLLLEHAEQPHFQMRHRWRADDLVIWDNRCTMHFAVSDYAPAHRLMHRVTVLGDRPTFVPT